MTRTLCVALVAALAATPLAAADRLSDRDLAKLVGRIDDERGKFEGAIDDTLKRSILRGPSGEVNIARFLDDFEESIDRLESRLSPEYAASTEAAAVLRQASMVDRFMTGQPAGYKGASEWTRLADDLRLLADAYGVSFPMPADASPRRMGDREVATTAETIARDADKLKKALDDQLKGAKAEKSARQSQVRDVEQLAKAAKTLRDRVRSQTPSSAEADRVVELAGRVQQHVTAGGGVTTTIWTALDGRLRNLASAYGRTWGAAAVQPMPAPAPMPTPAPAPAPMPAPAPAPMPAPAPAPAPAASGGTNASALHGTSWQLVQFRGGDDSVITPADPSRYTITFDATGQLSARVDCNRGRGQWSSDGPGRITFGPMAVTRAMCAPGSIDSQVLKQWTNIRSFVLRDGKLFLALMADGGIYEYAPLPAATPR